jgi:protein-S-isoprenylcysteine O-methyltransferase Ste14
VRADDRGTGWVVAQFALMAAALLARLVPPRWPSSLQPALGLAGLVLGVAGLALAVWAARTLGRALTPFPKPVPAGLVTHGPFAVVRHPIYTGGLALFAGYALWAGPVSLALAACLGLLWIGKTSVEERHLERVYPGYEAYRRRVRWRLVPFVV